jgi:uncharacterized protein (DUF2267 family)
MAIRSVDSIERSVHKTNEWLSELAAELGNGDREEAWRVLRAYLQLLRDRLNIDEAAQLAAQLPLVLRGAFYEGFDPGHQPVKLRDRDEFLGRLAEYAQLAGPAEAARAAEGATRVLRRHVTAGELDDVSRSFRARFASSCSAPEATHRSKANHCRGFRPYDRTVVARLDRRRIRGRGDRSAWRHV